MKDYFCEGIGLNSLIASYLVSIILAKSIYEKVIIICENKSDFASRVNSCFMYVQITMSFLLTFVCLIYFAVNPDIEEILANLAALLILNEIDNIVGFLLDIKTHQVLPKVMF
jgi:hypothetical protein